jgi:hypothetical protein
MGGQRKKDAPPAPRIDIELDSPVLLIASIALFVMVGHTTVRFFAAWAAWRRWRLTGTGMAALRAFPRIQSGANSMSTHETSIQPASQLPVAPSTGEKWQREFEAFQRLRPGLLATHSGQYVLIHNEKVLASGKDDLELALRFFAEYGNTPVHIGLVTSETEPVVRIPDCREYNQDDT